MKKPAEAGLVFSVYWYILPQRADQAASANELSFAVTCFASSARKPQPYGFHIPVLSTLLLFALSKPCSPNARYFFKYPPVEEGGFEPPSKTCFTSLHTAITLIYSTPKCVSIMPAIIIPGPLIFGSSYWRAISTHCLITLSAMS